MEFTAIIPVCNGGAKIACTIESILNQTGVRSGAIGLRLLVIDGASSDDTVAVAEGFGDPRIEVLSEPDSGMYDALAKGLEKATGEVTCYMPAGDKFDPHAFETVSEILTDYPQIGWITGQSTLRNHHGQIIGSRLPHTYHRRLFLNGSYGTTLWPLMQESTFWRTRLNGLVDLKRLRSFRAAGDFFLWWSFAAREELYVANSIFAAFTIEEDQLSARMADTYRDEILKVARAPTLMERLAVRRMKRPQRRFIPRAISRRLVHWSLKSGGWWATGETKGAEPRERPLESQLSLLIRR